MPFLRRGSTCEHNWVEDYDLDMDAECYNDGLNYTPLMLVCTRCGRKKRKPRTNVEKGDLVLFILFLPLMMITVFLFDLLLPILLVVHGLYQYFLNKKESSLDSRLQ